MFKKQAQNGERLTSNTDVFWGGEKEKKERKNKPQETTSWLKTAIYEDNFN